MSLFDMTEAKNVRYATYQFKVDTRLWWNLTKEFIKVAEITWAEFKKLFEQ